MSQMVAMGPSAETVGLIVGMSTVTMGSVLSAIGYFARRFLAQQTANHQDTLEALGIARNIQGQLPRFGYRLTRLEIAAAAAAVWAGIIAWRRK